jgi:hypothetical protein
VNTKTILIPLASLAAITTAALLTIGPPTAPAPECVQMKVEVEKPIDVPEPPRRFARPPAPPMPVPMPHAVGVG